MPQFIFIEGVYLNVNQITHVEFHRIYGESAEIHTLLPEAGYSSGSARTRVFKVINFDDEKFARLQKWLEEHCEITF